jgi:hypothetical protein
MKLRDNESGPWVWVVVVAFLVTMVALMFWGLSSGGMG